MLGVLVGCTSGVPDSPSSPPSARPHEAPAQESISEAPPPSSNATLRERSQSASQTTLSQRLEDARVEARVTSALVDEARLRVFDFNVRASKGRVTLRGDVNTRRQRQLATRMARSVRGVRDVRNDVTVGGRRAAPADPSGKRANAKASTPAPSSLASAASSTPSSAPQGAYHTVQQGETLWRIAQEYQASVDRIRTLNDMQGSSVKVGQRLRVR
jgi:LysM repeat protein